MARLILTNEIKPWSLRKMFRSPAAIFEMLKWESIIICVAFLCQIWPVPVEYLKYEWTVRLQGSLRMSCKDWYIFWYCYGESRKWSLHIILCMWSYRPVTHNSNLRPAEHEWHLWTEPNRKTIFMNRNRLKR